MAEDTLLAELRADSTGSNGQCTVCQWLDRQDNAEVWDKAFRDEQIRPAAIARKMKALGYQYTKAPVESHKRNSHRVG